MAHQNKITIHSAEEIAKMRIAGKLAAEVLEMLTPLVVAGVTTNELDAICNKYITEIQQAIPAPLGYRGFPKSICTSVNEEVCHGIPNNRKLVMGDIVNIDVTVKKDGYHGDTSRMFVITDNSNTNSEANSDAKSKLVLANMAKIEKLIRVTQECLYIGIRKVKPGAYLEHIGAAIQLHAEKHNFTVVREYCGHGIGKNFHEAPQVLHYRNNLTTRDAKFKTLTKLLPGMIFTIEPMINAGKKDTKEMPDNYPDNRVHTAVTKDGSLSAQFEHTILVTETGYEVLTKRAEEAELI